MLFKGNVDKREADDDFLLGRIGFLLTADKGEVVEQFVKEDHVLEDVSKVCQFLSSDNGSGLNSLCRTQRQGASCRNSFVSIGRDIKVHV